MIDGAQRRLRQRAWAAGLRSELRRGGCAAEIEIAPGAILSGRPRVRVRDWEGRGGSTLRVRIGDGAVIGQVVIEVWGNGENALEIGSHAELGDVVLQLQSGTITIGDRAQVRSWTVLKSAGELRLGRQVIVSFGSNLHCTERIELEEMVALAERVTVIDSEHVNDGSDEYFVDRPVTTAPVLLGRNAFVATGSVVDRGVTLGPNSVVAANSVVRGGDYDAGWLIGGLPAKPIRALAPNDSG